MRTHLYLVLCIFSGAVYAAPELKIISLQHRFPQDMLPTLQAMVGEDGSVSAVQNNLLIRATPERMSEIEDVIAGLDVEQKNLRITISHGESVLTQNRRAAASIGARIDNVHGQLGASANRNEVDIDLSNQQNQMRRQGSEFLTVLDGELAYIRAGVSMPVTQQWISLGQRYAHVQTMADYQEITTGFAVRARAIGKQIELQITPRIASLNSSGYIDFKELTTVVRVQSGQWFDIGGAMQSSDEVSRAILSMTTNSSQRGNTIQIRVDQ